ncbi:phosphonate degradation HD-domain oxygenase [Pseudanabaena sp. 'Roaring Creek']|uniref:phosphonate degradation HD-domain oxygenase n=1 Tax=Pseudanabaena sp. 'Roaring Creek' TaxID=1681830 RepID=UPI0006D7955D|nr:phosphonate degradation HD-domain oxygenase [Pseudanabaena sp. 'Roaring Creek']
MKLSLDEIFDIFDTKGDAQYGGEAITQLEHGLQCAALAQAKFASPELISACLLHDLGHLLHDLGENATDREIDDRHEYEGALCLEEIFAPAIAEPIRLHVEAKRYLCAIDSNYQARLSPNSQDSLRLQGGAFSTEEAKTFIALPYAKDAVKLRIWDDLAKVVGLKTPDLASFKSVVTSCLNGRNLL